MRNRIIYPVIIFFAAASVLACQKSAYINPASDNTPASGMLPSSGTGRYSDLAVANASTGPFSITLESRTQVGSNWEWIWSVQNPNPGNGTGGTVQNLSHWGMELGFCVTLNSIVSAAYSPDGVTWTGFTPTYQVDPSQTCYTSPIFKFDFGTTGGNKSYYKVVVNRYFEIGSVVGYYKSGKTTGCGIISFDGMSCNGEVDPK